MNFKVWIEAITPQSREYAKNLLSGKANPDKDAEPAYYDAIFNNPPYLNMIASKIPGHEFGWMAFLHFLNYVGVGKEFSSSDFTKQGKSLFDKAVQERVIQPIQKQLGFRDTLNRHTYWKVINDPMKILRRIATIP
jgi:hypothetical protein